MIKQMIGVLAVTALGGCSSFTGGELIRPGLPTGTLLVANGSGQPLDAIVVSECDAMSYGFNRLADGTSVPVGGEVSFIVSAGCYDVGGGVIGGGEGYSRLDVAAGGITRLTLE